MLEPKCEFFEDMDGDTQSIVDQVREVGDTLRQYVLAGDGIDAAIAMILRTSDDLPHAIQNCEYVCAELRKFAANLKREAQS